MHSQRVLAQQFLQEYQTHDGLNDATQLMRVCQAAKPRFSVTKCSGRGMKHSLVASSRQNGNGAVT